MSKGQFISIMVMLGILISVSMVNTMALTNIYRQLVQIFLAI